MCEEKSVEYLRDLFKEKEDVEKVDKVLLSKLLTQEISRVRLGGRPPGREGRLLDIYNEKPLKISAKVLVPVKEHPRFNFVGKLLGPKGNSLKRLQEDTMTKMAILGKGSMKNKQKEEELRNTSDPKNAHLKEDLHVEILAFAAPAEAYARIALALAEVRKYLIPDSNDEIRQEQMREIQIIKKTRVTGCSQHEDCSQMAPHDESHETGDQQLENSSESGLAKFPNMSPGSEDEKLSCMSLDSGLGKSPNMSPEIDHKKTSRRISEHWVSTQLLQHTDYALENSSSSSSQENDDTAVSHISPTPTMRNDDTSVSHVSRNPTMLTSSLAHPMPFLTAHTSSPSHPNSRSILCKFNLHRETFNDKRNNNYGGGGATTKILERILPKTHTCGKRRSEDRCGYFGLEDEAYKPTVKRNK